MARLVEQHTLGFDSGHDLRVVDQATGWALPLAGNLLKTDSLSLSLSPPLPLSCLHVFSLSLFQINKYILKNYSLRQSKSLIILQIKLYCYFNVHFFDN